MSATDVARKLGFLDKPMEQTIAYGYKPNQKGEGFFEDIASFFGGSVVGCHPCPNGHVGLGITKASYAKAIKMHKQHGGSFMDWVKKAGKLAKEKGLPLLGNVLPGEYGAIARAANSLINKDQSGGWAVSRAPAIEAHRLKEERALAARKRMRELPIMQLVPQSGNGLYIGHGAYNISKAHYNRAVRHHKQHGGSFWNSIKRTIGKVAKKVLPILHKVVPLIPGPAGMAANLALNLIPGLAPKQEEVQEGEGLKKGSAAMKAKMAHLRSLKKTKGKGLY